MDFHFVCKRSFESYKEELIVISILICDCKTNFDEGVIQCSCSTLDQFQNFKEISTFSRIKI